ncbi:MAG: aminomethyl-transferring glycine dehydrogenase subunit GcvPA [Candidatus Aminicenantes bacterium]|nr:MAG: aminomethyl-transferring glycine dehydrogenase subunit GcvPA [Candidatus Aminicenantes bacterium]
MSYISLSEKDKKEMLAKIGISSVDELFQCIPDDLKVNQKLDVPEALTEPELTRQIEEIANQNSYQQFLSFLGAGAYSHVIPSAVDYLSSRGEFISPYTPYQPEISQGTLQIIFEFQTLICQLTGMDIANASLYDGASGAAEAALMAHRIKSRRKILVAKSIHPQYREVIQTYTRNLELSVEEIDFSDRGEVDFEDLNKKLDEDTAAVLIQSPNFFGVIEHIDHISALTHERQALSVVVVAEPVSLGILETPGNQGADIVTGEGQSFGLPLSFGGPYLGFMACQKEFLRQFPGRIAGETKDVDGKRGFVLTLSAREQHIRRERATSNICTNQAWCALRATIFLELLGKKGLKELAWQNIQKANYARNRISLIKGIEPRFRGACFNEFIIEFEKPWADIDSFLQEKGIIGGLCVTNSYPELSNCVLVCVTESHKKEDIDRFVDHLEEACS